MATFAKYAVNKTKEPKATVQLIDGKIIVPIDGWVGLTTREADHEDIVYAIRRDWIELVDKEPSAVAAPEQPKPEVSTPTPQGSTTPPVAKKTTKADAAAQ